MSSVKGTIIIDNGTDTLKAGFAGDNDPLVHAPAAVGWKRIDKKGYVITSPTYDHLYLGSEILGKYDIAVSAALSHGIIKDWDYIEKLWDYIIAEQLQSDAQEYTMLLTESTINSDQNRQRMAEIMFEGFKVPGIHFGNQSILALYSEGLTTGLVVDIGEASTEVLPVYDGCGIDAALQRQDLAGHDLTNSLKLLFQERGIMLTSASQKHILQMIKEKFCYVAEDFETEMRRYEANPQFFEKQLVLPDGQTISIGSERFRCSECLFRPHFTGKEIDSVPDLISSSIQKSAIDIRKSLMRSILLSGGTTMLNGFPSRLRQELSNSFSSTFGLKSEYKVLCPNERRDCVWRGASVLAILPTFSNLVITIDDYEEIGPSVCSKRSFNLGDDSDYF